MPRYIKQGIFQDGQGNIVASGTISVYLADGTTVVSVYAAESGGSAVNSVTSGSDGSWLFWVDDADYAHTQKFKLTLSKTNYITKSYDDVVIFPPAASQVSIAAQSGKFLEDLMDGGYDINIKPLTIITKSGPRLNATAWGATGDGATDDRAALQNAIDNAGGRDVYLPAGTYLLTPSGGLLLNFSSKNLRHFYGDGDKTIIKVVNSGNPNYGMYVDGGAAGLIFDGFKFDMNSANQASGNNYGWYVRNTSRIKIRDIWGINSRGTFVWITEIAGETTQDISVSNCIFDGTTLLAAVSVDSGRDIFIDGNIITNTGVVGIDIETASGTTLKNVHVTNNKLRSCYAGIQNYGGNTSRGILIANNLIDTTTTGSGIRVYSSAAKECVVANNVVLNAFTHGIHLESAVGVSVMGNTVWNSGIQNSGTYGGITLDGATECLVAGNLCSDNQGTKTQDYGIYEIAPANNNLLVGNQLRNNGTTGILKVGATTIRVGNLAGGGEDTGNLDMGTAVITDANIAHKTTSTTTTPYNMSNGDTILMNATAGAKTVVPPVAPDTGRTVTIKKVDSSGNAVTVDPTAALTIDGAATYSLATQWKYVVIRYDGANWVVVANN